MVDSPDADRLRQAGLRPTHQRVAVARLLREAGVVHVTADEAFKMASDRRLRLPFATIYNTLNIFAKAGLVRRLDHGEKTCFCTNLAGHHHFLDLSTGRLTDIPDPQPAVIGLPGPPPGMEIEGVEVIVRLKAK